MKECYLPLPDSAPLHAYCLDQSSDLRYQEVAVRTEGGQKRGFKIMELTQMQLAKVAQITEQTPKTMSWGQEGGKLTAVANQRVRVYYSCRLDFVRLQLQ